MLTSPFLYPKHFLMWDSISKSYTVPDNLVLWVTLLIMQSIKAKNVIYDPTETNNAIIDYKNNVVHRNNSSFITKH